MGPTVIDGGSAPSTITFDNGNTALVAWGGRRRTVRSLLDEVGLEAQRPVLLVVGGADSLDASIELQLRRQLERGAIRAAAEAGAAILDGGTQSGVMASLGLASAASDESVVLVGVAPAGKVTFPGDSRPGAESRTQLDPNHTHFLLAKSDDWGGETSLMFDALDGLDRDSPAAVLIAGGGPVAFDEVAAASARGLTIVAISGTGGVADLLTKAGPANPVAGVDAARVAALTAAADVAVVELNADPGQLAHLLARLLHVDETLRDAWLRQALVSAAARREQRSFRGQQNLVLTLGVILTLLVVANAVLGEAGRLPDGSPAQIAFYLAILVIPIGVGIAVAAAGRLRPGTRWILLRATSETIKREIFRYRTRAGIYSHENTVHVPRETKLASKVGLAMSALMRTDVNLMALDPDADRSAAQRRKWRKDAAAQAARDAKGKVSWWRRLRPAAARPKDPSGSPEKVSWWRRLRPAAAPPKDPTVSPEQLTSLTPGGYIKARIDDQLGWYEEKAATLSRESQRLQLLGLLIGGLGTLLAAVHLQIYVAVTTAIVAAFATYRATWQIETSLTLYNQAAASLGAIRLWWFALTPAEQARQVNIDKLVDGAEGVMKAEHGGWVQEMQDAIGQLRLEPTDGGPAPVRGPRRRRRADEHPGAGQGGTHEDADDDEEDLPL